MSDSRHAPTTPDSRHAPTTPDSRHAPTMPDSRHADGHRDAPAAGGRFGFGKPGRAEAPSTNPDELPTTSPGPQGHHAEAPAKAPADDQPGDATAAGGSGRRSRFGLKKRKDNNDYVDWVSGLGNDPS
jgi:hypothetical protein